MSGITVTIYNDDKHGRDFQVMQINTLSGRDATYAIQKASGDGEDIATEQYELMPGDIIIITPTGT